MRYDLIRKGGNVKRYHARLTIRENSVAAHSWGVATLILHCCDNPSLNLIKASLYHDVFEYITGDVPYTAKRMSPALDDALTELEKRAGEIMEMDMVWNLSPEEEGLLKTCDMLDLCLFANEEITMGNKDMVEVMLNGHRFLTSHFKEFPNSKALTLLQNCRLG